VSGIEVSIDTIAFVCFVVGALFILWRWARSDAEYWREQAQDYQRRWDKATWDKEDD